MSFIVIENTPGYLPEDDDPLITEDYHAAVRFANELADEYENDADAEYPWIVDRSWASRDNYYAISITSERPYELGRVIEVVQVEDDEG